MKSPAAVPEHLAVFFDIVMDALVEQVLAEQQAEELAAEARDTACGQPRGSIGNG